jgi:hypothetical protein
VEPEGDDGEGPVHDHEHEAGHQRRDERRGAGDGAADDGAEDDAQEHVERAGLGQEAPLADPRHREAERRRRPPPGRHVPRRQLVLRQLDPQRHVKLAQKCVHVRDLPPGGPV